MPRTIKVGEFEITVDPFVTIWQDDGELLMLTRQEWREVRDAVDILIQQSKKGEVDA